MKSGKIALLVFVLALVAGASLLISKVPGKTEVVVDEATPETKAVAEEPKPIATPEPSVETPKAPVASPSEDVASRIKENLADARKIMQQKAALEKAKPEEVHHMPKATLDAARRLAEISELEAQHPEEADTFRDFYLECARDEATITVTRAQCLDRYIKAAKMDAAAQKDFLAEFPPEIARLIEATQ